MRLRALLCVGFLCLTGCRTSGLPPVESFSAPCRVEAQAVNVVLGLFEALSESKDPAGLIRQELLAEASMEAVHMDAVVMAAVNLGACLTLESKQYRKNLLFGRLSKEVGDEMYASLKSSSETGWQSLQKLRQIIEERLPRWYDAALLRMSESHRNMIALKGAMTAVPQDYYVVKDTVDIRSRIDGLGERVVRLSAGMLVMAEPPEPLSPWQLVTLPDGRMGYSLQRQLSPDLFTLRRAASWRGAPKAPKDDAAFYRLVETLLLARGDALGRVIDRMASFYVIEKNVAAPALPNG